MELDFRTVRALSSASRIEILNLVAEDSWTPTDLAEEIGKSKSTVVSHLSKLEKAGLVEKDAVEGRKRVMYSGTRKAGSIVAGKEKTVKFSIATSAVSGLLAALATPYWFTELFGGSSASGEMEALDAAARTASSEGGFPGAEVALVASILLIVLAFGTLFYGMLFRRLGGEP